MLKKRFLSMTIIILMILLLYLTGCGNSSTTTEKANAEKTNGSITLTLAVNFAETDVTTQNLKTIAKNFEQENPNIRVNVTSLPDYEATMKTKMAANDLPDMWTTHGWSVMRYSGYLLPLQDQPWASKINPLIKPIITDKEGKIYVLPMDVDVAGIAFNKDVLDKAGVDPDSIKTWDDFKVACDKIKAIGKIPVYLGGSQNAWTVGNFFDWVAPSFLVTDDNHNFRKELKDGTFDWNNYRPVAQLFVDFIKAGYFNKNANEGTWQEVGEALAKGEAGFAFFGNYVIGEAMKYNPNGNYGFMPLPAAYKDGERTVIVGERTAIGVWKDSKYKNEALKFLEYLAKPENINLVAKGNMTPTGLVGDGYKLDAGKLSPYFENAAKYKGFGYFDREYLPNGMWDSLCKTGTGMLAGTMSIDQVIAQLKADYQRLYQQQK
jgi:raffinose/stachyose/melibiose transport system substrate-binding protein